MDETQAQEFYADPENQVPAGPAHRRAGRRLSATVPVRFPQALIDAVKRLADRDGVTVSSWIRRVVEREVVRRQPVAVTVASSLPVRFEASNLPSGPPATVAPPAPEQLQLECIA
jgi:predicted DNA binding CopG/RHH family protein